MATALRATRPAAPRSAAPYRGPRASRALGLVAQHAVAIALAAAFLVPFLVIALTAFMSQQQAGTGRLWPQPWVWSNFAEVFRAMPFGRDLLNTIVYAGVSAVGVMVSSTLAAYALARLRWGAREHVFVVVLVAMMIPAQVTSLPLYVLYSRMGLVGTLWPLILPNLLCDAYSIFLLRQFFLTIPTEIQEAARVDGASDWRILTQVIVPMAKPGIAAVGLFSFLYAWNDFYNPLLYTGNSNSSQTLAVGLASLAQSVHQQSYQLQMAASLMFTLPVIVIFFFAQRVFIEGVNVGGVKE